MGNTPVRQEPNKPTTVNGSSPAKAPAVGEYYSAVSGKYRIAKFITILLLIVFLILSFTFLRDDITLENLRYLLKFISFTNTETSISVAKISYPSGDPNRLELYMGDLCTLSPSGYALYDARGNQIMAEAINYVAPVLKVSDRYTLCYDMDGYSFTVLNSFSKLYDQTVDYPITAGAVSNEGYFAIAASSREYRTAVTLYNDDFKPVTRIYKNDHLMGMEFSPDGKTLALMTSGVFNGEFYTKIELVSVNSDKVTDQAEIAGLGYNFFFTDTGYIAITDEGVNFFDSTLTPTKRIPHTSQLSMADCSKKHLTCIYSDGILGNSNLVNIYTSDGKLVYEGTLYDKLIALDSDESGDFVFVLTGTTLTRINLQNKKIGNISVSKDAFDLIAQNGSSVLVALKNYALTYELSDIYEQYYYRPDEAPTPPQATEESSADSFEGGGDVSGENTDTEADSTQSTSSENADT